MTVTGEAVAQPGNFMVRCGTSYEEVIAAAGGFKNKPMKIISGGPMMGFAVSSTKVAVTKTTSGILVLDEKHTAEYSSMPCISCGRCNNACPLSLLPSEMSCAIEADDIDTAIELHVSDCFDCGCCGYVCPSHRPLVQHFRRAKGILGVRVARAKAEAQAKAQEKKQ